MATSALEPGPYLADICARESCRHPLNFHDFDPTTGRRVCKRQIHPADLPAGSEVRAMAERETLVCGCEDFEPSEADARRDRRWRQDMAHSVLDGLEVAIGEAFEKDVTDKTAPLLRRIGAIMRRATIAGE
jgi:hypothetical protein